MDHDEPNHEMPDDSAETAAIDLVEVDAAGGPTRWWQAARRHRRVLQAVVAVLVLLAAFATSAAVTTPGTDDDALETTDPESARAGQGRTDARDGATPSSEDTPGEGDGDGAGTGGGRRRGDRSADRKADRERDHDDEKDRGGRDPRPPSGGGGTTTPPGPPPTLTLEVGPTLLAPFGQVTVAPGAPCPAGTTVARVEVTAVGGTRAASVVASREVPVAGDGLWSVAPFTVPVLGGVDGVDWAATADEVVVGASCLGGSAPRYVSVTVGLEEATVAPVLQATLTAGAVDAELDGCPTAAVLHLVVAASPPPPGEDFAPTSTVAMVRADPAEPWSAEVTAPAVEPGEGLWASASCLDAPGGATVWRTAPVALVAP